MSVPALDLAAAADGLFVVETWDGDAFLGEISFETGYVVIYTGFRGRPAIILRNDAPPSQRRPTIRTSSWTPPPTRANRGGFRGSLQRLAELS